MTIEGAQREGRSERDCDAPLMGESFVEVFKMLKVGKIYLFFGKLAESGSLFIEE